MSLRHAALAAALVAPLSAFAQDEQVVFTMGQIEIFAREPSTTVTITNLVDGALYKTIQLTNAGDRYSQTTGVPNYVAVAADKPVTLFSGKALAGSNDWGSVINSDNTTEFGERHHGFTEAWMWVFVPRDPGDTSKTLVEIVDLSDGDDTIALTERQATKVTSSLEVFQRSGFENDTVLVECSRPCMVQVGSSSIDTSTGWAFTPPSTAEGEDGRELGTRFSFFAHPDVTIWPFSDDTVVSITDLSDGDDTRSVTLDASEFFTLRNLSGVSRGQRTVVHANGNLFDSDFVQIEASKPVRVYSGPNYDPGGGFTLDFTATMPTSPGVHEAFVYANQAGLILLAHDDATTVTLDTVTGDTTHAITVGAAQWQGVGPYYWHGRTDWARELVHVVADAPISVFSGDFDPTYYPGCCSASFVPVVPADAVLPPVADAGVSVIACPYDTITYDGTASYDVDAVGSDPDIVAWSWDFDASVDSDGVGGPADDVESAEPTGEHTYPASDLYTIRLQVTDNDGQTDADVVLVEIDVSNLALCGADGDGDDVGDNNDNCDGAFNPDQSDADLDGIGDACDTDSDNDLLDDDADNCTLVPNPGQENHDTDALGDACDDDDDGDGVLDADDLCPLVEDDQTDTDGDGVGDACDDDADGDGHDNDDDNCPLIENPGQGDVDGTGGGDLCDDDADGDGDVNDLDNCWLVANADQKNTDNDAFGDACDPDDDNDGIPDGIDSCPLAADATLLDTDRDGTGDVCDADDDGDGHDDGDDNCPLVANADQANADTDADGDACDGDRDGDGHDDGDDNCPGAANPDQADHDNDGIGDPCDADDDGDGISDAVDSCPLDADSTLLDTDGDGTGDPCDADDDGDGHADAADNCPLVANSDQANADGDADGDACDGDRDGDGVGDGADNCAGVSNADQADHDADGLGDPCDADADGDAVLDYDDNCLLLGNHVQLDGNDDGVGDACDDDDDGDGVLDADDNCPVDANANQADDDGDGVGNVCSDSVAYLAGGCDCATGGGPGAGWALLGLAGVLARRRTRARG